MFEKAAVTGRFDDRPLLAVKTDTTDCVTSMTSSSGCDAQVSHLPVLARLIACANNY